jgi:hypothetical protein
VVAKSVNTLKFAPLRVARSTKPGAFDVLSFAPRVKAPTSSSGSAAISAKTTCVRRRPSCRRASARQRRGRAVVVRVVAIVGVLMPTPAT